MRQEGFVRDLVLGKSKQAKFQRTSVQLSVLFTVAKKEQHVHLLLRSGHKRKPRMSHHLLWQIHDPILAVTIILAALACLGHRDLMTM